MNALTSSRTRAAAFGLACAIAFSAPTAVLAHNVIGSVYPTSTTLEGELLFSDGTVIAGQSVRVYDADGNEIDELTTDEDGFFSYTPTKHMRYVFKADMGAGHVAEIVVEPADLPASLAANGADAATITVGENAPIASGPSSATIPDAVDAAAIQDAIATAVREEIRPLRRQIVEMENAQRWTDILSGISWIVGMLGLWAFVTYHRQIKAGKTATNPATEGKS